jgi:hypothetical protein
MGISSFNENSDTQRKHNNLLYAAIQAGDVEKALRALKDGANPDADDGKPLRLCVDNDDYLMAKALMLKGADIGYALLRCARDIENVPTRPHKIHSITIDLPATEADSQNRARLKAQSNKLANFQQTFNETSLPQEQLRLTQEINERLIRLEKEVKQLSEPQPLGKPAAPGLPNRKP